MYHPSPPPAAPESAGEEEPEEGETYPRWTMPSPKVSAGYAGEMEDPRIPMGFAIPHVAPDDPCPCGSGLRYCRCHGKFLT